MVLSGATYLGSIVWVVISKSILKHAQCLCQFYELRKLNMHTGVEGYGFVAWFGQYTEMAFLVSLSFLFGFTQPIVDIWIAFDMDVDVVCFVSSFVDQFCFVFRIFWDSSSFGTNTRVRSPF